MGLLDSTPERRIVPVTFTVAAGTLQASPASTTFDLGDVVLYHVSILVPRGHNAATGVQVMSNGLALVPWGSPDTWLIADGEPLSFPVEVHLGVAIQLRGFNVGQYAHSFYFRFEVKDTGLILAERAGGPQLIAVRAM